MPEYEKSYLANNAGHEWASWRKHFFEINQQSAMAAHTLMRVATAQQQIWEAFQIRWSNQRLLDVGAGQLLRQSLALGFDNQVVAIDLELPFRGLMVLDFLSTARSMGLRRAFKTLLRQTAGVDRRFRKALMTQAGAAQLPALQVRRMNATRLNFSDASFDGAFSFSTFQHIDEPELAAREVCRVLKPGGIVYIELHLYTSITGSDHPLLRTAPGTIPDWGHLRRSTTYFGKHGLFVNAWRMSTWQAMLERSFGEVRLFFNESERNATRMQLTPEIRQELAGYSEDELVTTTFVAVCRKSHA